MYVSVYVYLCERLSKRECISERMFLYRCVCVCVYTYVHACVCVCMRARVRVLCVCLPASVCLSVCLFLSLPHCPRVSRSHYVPPAPLPPISLSSRSFTCSAAAPYRPVQTIYRCQPLSRRWRYVSPYTVCDAQRLVGIWATRFLFLFFLKTNQGIVRE